MLNGRWVGFNCSPDDAGYPTGFVEAWADRLRKFERVYVNPPAAVVVFVPEDSRVAVQKAIAELLNGPAEPQPRFRAATEDELDHPA